MLVISVGFALSSCAVGKPAASTVSKSEVNGGVDNTPPAPVPSPPPTLPPKKIQWAVNGHLPAADTTQEVPALDRAVEMHFSMVRLDMSWAIVEPDPRNNIGVTGNWQVLDASVDQVFKRGMKPLAILGSTPTWASSNGAENGTLSVDGQAHFVEYVRAMVQRYQGKVEFYEIGNEPNLNVFWVGTADQYIDQLLIPARDIIKNFDPNLKVVGPALSNLLNSTIKIESFYQTLGVRQSTYKKDHNGQGFFDIISQHAYNTTPTDVAAEFTQGRLTCILGICIKKRESLLKIFSDNGFDKEPIWLDEFGWATTAGDANSEETQGKYLLETLQRLAPVPRLEAAFIYHLWDDPRIANDFGVLKSDYQPKHAYDYLRNSSP